MNIALIGAGGFIGSKLTQHLESYGHTVQKISHRDIAPKTLSNSEIVINLAGASINHRWTARYKKQILDSREQTTKKVVETINHLHPMPVLFINASAVGIYSAIGCHDESSTRYDDRFLGHVAQAWEAQARKADSRIRTVIIRLGVVLSPDGGALKQLLRPVKMGVAVTIGNGRQHFSWIAMDDLLRAVEFIISNQDINGIVNITAPQSVTNGEMTEILAEKYRCVIRIAIAQWAIGLIMGRRAQVVIGGQCATPKVLTDNGFSFNFKTFKSYITTL